MMIARGMTIAPAVVISAMIPVVAPGVIAIPVVVAMHDAGPVHGNGRAVLRAMVALFADAARRGRSDGDDRS